MAQLRIWHASRDPYHCAFRMIRLLACRSDAIPIERLRVLDMLLLYPALLYRVSLPSAIKERFRSLSLEPPAKSFVRLPSTASIWQDLQVYQSAALTHLGGRAILDNAEIRERRAMLKREMLPTGLWDRACVTNDSQSPLMRFLVEDLASLPITGKDNLFKRAGLPARGPVL